MLGYDGRSARHRAVGRAIAGPADQAGVAAPAIWSIVVRRSAASRRDPLTRQSIVVPAQENAIGIQARGAIGTFQPIRSQPR